MTHRVQVNPRPQFAGLGVRTCLGGAGTQNIFRQELGLVNQECLFSQIFGTNPWVDTEESGPHMGGRVNPCIPIVLNRGVRKGEGTPPHPPVRWCGEPPCCEAQSSVVLWSAVKSGQVVWIAVK